MPITSLQTICIGDGVSFKCTETNENVSFLALNIHLSDDMIQINAVTCSLYAVLYARHKLTVKLRNVGTYGSEPDLGIHSFSLHFTIWTHYFMIKQLFAVFDSYVKYFITHLEYLIGSIYFFEINMFVIFYLVKNGKISV